MWCGWCWGLLPLYGVLLHLLMHQTHTTCLLMIQMITLILSSETIKMTLVNLQWGSVHGVCVKLQEEGIVLCLDSDLSAAVCCCTTEGCEREVWWSWGQLYNCTSDIYLASLWNEIQQLPLLVWFHCILNAYSVCRTFCLYCLCVIVQVAFIWLLSENKMQQLPVLDDFNTF